MNFGDWVGALVHHHKFGNQLVNEVHEDGFAVLWPWDSNSTNVYWRRVACIDLTLLRKDALEGMKSWNPSQS